MKTRVWFVFMLACYGLFLLFLSFRAGGKAQLLERLEDRVVVSAPVQVALAGGDRFLAANLEGIRLLTTVDDFHEAIAVNMVYRIRAHRVVAQLNPCHEDNYYVANAMLSWGGAPSDGMEVLRRAGECRFWDEYPPFFYGFGQWHFNRDATKARAALEQAAERVTEPRFAASYRRMGIMVEAGSYEDGEVALAFLQREQALAVDDRLKDMLGKRIQRLEGLLILRAAQAEYESRFTSSLPNPQALLAAGILAEFPSDPLGLGYEFVEGRFALREMSVQGLNRP